MAKNLFSCSLVFQQLELKELLPFLLNGQGLLPPPLGGAAALPQP